MPTISTTATLFLILTTLVRIFLLMQQYFPIFLKNDRLISCISRSGRKSKILKISRFVMLFLLEIICKIFSVYFLLHFVTLLQSKIVKDCRV